jgi:hypothetical protein
VHVDPYIILGGAIVGLLVGLTGAGGGALMPPMLIDRGAGEPAAESAAAGDGGLPGRTAKLSPSSARTSPLKVLPRPSASRA